MFYKTKIKSIDAHYHTSKYAQPEQAFWTDVSRETSCPGFHVKHRAQLGARAVDSLITSFG
jgi:hypothetical protein